MLSTEKGSGSAMVPREKEMSSIGRMVHDRVPVPNVADVGRWLASALVLVAHVVLNVLPHDVGLRRMKMSWVVALKLWRRLEHLGDGVSVPLRATLGLAPTRPRCSSYLTLSEEHRWVTGPECAMCSAERVLIVCRRRLHVIGVLEL